jgi:predicted dehydrogenase
MESEDHMSTNELTYGMVGGDVKAFIGDVHRKAIGFDPRCHLVAGAFSIDPVLHVLTADTYHIAKDRRYNDYKEMAEAESKRKDKIDFVVIVTPNASHYQISKEFLLHDINVICEKPLCFTLEEANELSKIAKDRNLLFAVNYGYTGYTMVKIAKEMIAKKELGKLLSVQIQYAQDWLIDTTDSTKSAEMGKKIWRLDPKASGISCSLGDIGTHAENLFRYLTGDEIKRLVVSTDKYGQALDLNSNVIIQCQDGLHVGIWVSQVAIGCENGLKFQIYGTKGSLNWNQQDPDTLYYGLLHEPQMKLVRGSNYLKKYEASSNSRLPSGHPEGLYEAFANNYRHIISYLIKKKGKEEPTLEDCDFPTIADGLDGVKFVHKAIQSATEEKWLEY